MAQGRRNVLDPFAPLGGQMDAETAALSEEVAAVNRTEACLATWEEEEGEVEAVAHRPSSGRPLSPVSTQLLSSAAALLCQSAEVALRGQSTDPPLLLHLGTLLASILEALEAAVGPR